MHPYLDKLTGISSQNERVILGLMSGTSMDGLDMALCVISGSGRQTSFKVRQFTSQRYPDEVKSKLLELTSVDRMDTEELCIWHSYLAEVHVEMASKACSEWDVSFEDIDLIASHGHTVYHAPKRKHNQPGMPNTTLQIGDGDHIAHRTGVITLSDFRQKDTARGGEGAPLAAYGDFLLFSHPENNRILINLGGIANFTYLPANSYTFPPLSMDTGPANTLIDAAMRKYFDGKAYDEGGMIASKGRVHEDVLEELKKHPYLSQSYPKTTGPEMFRLDLLDGALSKTGKNGVSGDDIIATLTRFSVETLADAIKQVTDDPEHCEFFISGGGTANMTMIRWLSDELGGAEIKTTSAIGLDPDAKEAVFFAVLANETICGDGTLPALGKISFP